MPHISYTRHFTSSATPQPPVDNNNKSISGHRSPCPNPAADAKFHTNIDPASLETLVQEKKDELFRLLLQMDLHNDSCEKSAEENKAILRLLQQFRPETQDNTTLSRADTKNSANRYVLPVSII
uniref:Uncharacterized protein n=1 Tax=Oryza punctata TaxID=4537 RepID=A0A0E0KLB1_ORYPU